MRPIKAVKQNYQPTQEIIELLENFRCMVNDCIRIGLESHTTSMKALSLKCYHRLAHYPIYSQYRLTANSRAAGLLRNYRKAEHDGKAVKEPYASRPQLVACYGFKIQGSNLLLPIRAEGRGYSAIHVSIPLNRHTLAVLAEFNVRSVTLTGRTINISYSKETAEIEPTGYIGVDRNLNNVTTANSNGQVQQLDLSKATRTKAQCRETKRHMTRNDVRIRRRVCGKYGVKQRNRVQQILHQASKMIVQEAKRDQHGIVMENLKNIRRLYRKGNWQGNKYRSVMNGWSYYELQRQIQYKAQWEGIPVIYVYPHGTSVKCSICGSRMNRSRKPEENRKLKCPSCGYTVDRDVNAARNILARGLRFKPVGLSVEAMVSVFNPSVDGNQLTS